MQKFFFIMSFTFLFSLCCAMEEQEKLKFYYTFQSFAQECSKLPTDRRPLKTPLVGAQGRRDFRDCIEACVNEQKKELSEHKWLGEPYNHEVESEGKRVFQPFVQKLEVKPGTRVALLGDLHGDVHSLLQYIYNLLKNGYMDQEDPFKIAHEDVCLLFLGDYVDKGFFGPEVLYIIGRLWLANRKQVFLTRGNHEDLTMNTKYGFIDQLRTVSFDATNTRHLIAQLYDVLPVALYLGCTNTSGTKDLIQCCHGGIELGYNPNELLESDNEYQLVGKLNIEDNFNKLNLTQDEKDLIKKHVPAEQLQNIIPTAPISYINSNDPKNSPMYPFGFLWGDFMVLEYYAEPDGKQILAYYNPSRTLTCGKIFTAKVLEQHSCPKATIWGIVRGHQHAPKEDDPMMKRIANKDHKGSKADRGCGKLWIAEGTDPEKTKNLWPGIVCTFQVAPHTGYGLWVKKSFAYGLLTVSSGFENWRLQVTPLYPKKTHTKENGEEEKD